jgi:LacI family transcriptional regulator
MESSKESSRTKNGARKPRSASRKVTLADVGKLAGVSSATVSMILGGRDDVSFSSGTIAAVRKAADALRYQAVAGRSLARPVRKAAGLDKSMILIVCPNVLNPYYNTLVQAIQQSAAQRNCDSCVYVTYRSRESELAALRLAENADFAGIVFTMIAYPDEVIPRIGPRMPVVVISDRHTSFDVDTVELNNYDAGSQVARHLHELGHRHIAYISTTLDLANSARTQRLKGLKETFLALDSESTVMVKSRDTFPEIERDNIEIEYSVGKELAYKCFAEKRITALVAINDMVACGVIDAVHEAGLKVPDDYSVCGFDNILPSRFAGVSLTTIEHYMWDKGHNAFDILYARMNGLASARNITRVEFRNQLIVRSSTAPPRP